MPNAAPLLTLDSFFEEALGAARDLARLRAKGRVHGGLNPEPFMRNPAGRITALASAKERRDVSRKSRRTPPPAESTKVPGKEGA